MPTVFYASFLVEAAMELETASDQSSELVKTLLNRLEMTLTPA